jgi:MFS family permease
MWHVLRLGEFRALWVAGLLSTLGDQLSRVALSVLVFTSTGSAALSATTYALTFLPSLAGGVLLGWVADRFRRRTVMVAVDVARALAVAVMAVPGLPMPALCAVLVASVLLGAPYSAAEGAVIPEVTGEKLYEAGLAVRQMTNQTAQVAGFAAGGLIVMALSPNVALLVDAGTFLVSAMVVRAGLAARPRPGTLEVAGGGTGGETGEVSVLRDVMAGFGAIATDPARRALVALAWLVGLYVVPEALAVPYVQASGAGPAMAGVLMAADPLGSVLGAWVFVRFVPLEARERFMGPLAIAAGLPLLLMATDPPLPVVMVLWSLVGAFSTAYLLQTQASFVRRTPDALRGQAIGVAASGVIAAQGVAVFVAGILADRWGPQAAIVVAGVAGVVATGLSSLSWARARLPVREAASAY